MTLCGVAEAIRDAVKGLLVLSRDLAVLKVLDSCQ